MGRPGALVLSACLAACLAACESTDPMDLFRAEATVAELRGDWSATPYALAPALVAEADAACRAAIQRVGIDMAEEGYRLAVIDARGRGLLYAWYVGEPTKFRWCIDVPILEFGAIGDVRRSASGPMPPERALEDLLPDDVWVLQLPFDRGGPAQTVIMGVAGPDVASVLLIQPEGVPTQAALNDGWFALWLPDEVQDDARLKGYDVAGEEIEDVPVEPPDPDGPPFFAF